MKVRDRVFAVYRGEVLLASGTIKECAKQLDVKESSVTFYRTPTYAKRTSENARRLVRLDDDE